MVVQLSLFGSFTASVEGQALAFSTTRSKALLAYLAMRTDLSQQRDAVAMLLWPDRPLDKSKNSLRTELSRVRGSLGQALHEEEVARFLTTDGHLLNLDPKRLDVDVLRFRHRFHTSMDHQHARIEQCDECITRLHEAVSLHQGPLLEDIWLDNNIGFEEWLLFERESLERQCLEAQDILIRHYEATGDLERVIDYGYRQLQIQPWREQSYRTLMRAHTLKGQRGAALQQFERCHTILEEELQVTPSEETRNLYEQIRADAIVPMQRQLRRTPYKGLSPFGEEDAKDFFGREETVEKLLNLIQIHDLVGLVGPSGCGKSSVLRAGLIPALRQHVDSHTTLPHGEGVRVASFRPGATPVRALAEAIASNLGTVNTHDLLPILKGHSKPLSELLVPFVPEANDTGPPAKLFLIVDQFEELYSLCHDENRRALFTELLLDATRSHAENTPACHIAVLIALRADFMAQALGHRTLADALQQATVVLGPMTREEMRRAIENPARMQGVVFEPGLVDRLIDDVGHRPGNLPLLEFALTQLWPKQDQIWIYHDSYEEIGRITGALTYYADGIYARLQPHEQVRARRIFLQMVEPGQRTDDTRRPATRAELGEADWPLVRRLADNRLVVTDRNATGEETAELIHEALIREWTRLQAWLETDREFRIWQQRLRLAADEWERTQQDPGTLLRGGPLAETERWLDERGDELSERALHFIHASLERRAKREQAEEEQRQREIEQAQALARAESQRARVEARSSNRLRRLLIVLSALLAIAVIATLFAYNRQQVAQRESNAAQLALDDAEASAQLALARQLHAQALQYLDADVDLALLLSLEALRLADSPQDDQRLLTSLNVNPFLHKVLHDQDTPVYQLAFTPDGQLITGNENGDIFFWDPESGTLVNQWPNPYMEPRGLSIAPDGRHMATSQGTNLTLWQTENNRQIMQFDDHSGNVNHVTFSQDGRFLVSTDEAERLRLWDVESGELAVERDTLSISGKAPYTYDGVTFAVLDFDDSLYVTVQNIQTGETIGETLRGHTEVVHDMTFSPDGRLFASASFDGSIRLYDTQEGEQVGQPLRRHDGRVLFVNFSPDGLSLVSGGTDNQIIFWDVETGLPVGRPLTGHSNWVRRGAFSQDGEFLATGDASGEVILWRVGNRTVLRGHTNRVRTVALSPDQQTLITNGFDRRLLFWDARSGRRERSLATPHTHSIIHGKFSPDGSLYATADAEGILYLWDTERWELTQAAMQDREDVLLGLAFSPDSSTVATGGFDGTIALWDVDTGELIGDPITAHNGWAMSLAFTPDGSTLYSGSTTGVIKAWDSQTLEPVTEPLEAHANWVTDLHITPDGQTLLSASADQSVRFWSVQSHEQAGEPLQGHEAQIWGVDVLDLQTGQFIVTLGGDGTLLAWDWQNRQPVSPPLHTGLETENMVVSQDGERLYLASTGATAQMWQLPTLRWEAHACAMTNRNLTLVEWRTFLHDIPYNDTCGSFLPYRR